jgi:hypothetical protein
MAPFMANAISLAALSSTIQDKHEELTQAQFYEYVPTLIGVEVSWLGKVSDVKERERTDLSKEKSYKLYLVGMKYSVIELNVLRVRIGALDYKTALSLNKDQEYNFSGKVVRAEYVVDFFDSGDYVYVDVVIDAGPMKHPVRPESYIEMNNFY